MPIIHSVRFFHTLTKVSFLTAFLQSQPIATDLNKIYHHPFNRELFAGTLKADIFGRYLRDDHYYLQHYAKVLKKLSCKISHQNPELAKQLDYMATEIITGEQEMQEQYHQYFNPEISYKSGETISSYVEFLTLTVDTAPTPVALSSILPCFWIYYQLGLMPSSENNPYKQWIETYSSPKFVEATLQLTKTINQLAEQATPQMQIEIKKVISEATRYELKFFNEVNKAPEQQLQLSLPLS